MIKPLKLSLSSVVTAIPEHVCSDLNGEIVILNLKSGTYFGLNETGALVWNLIKEPKTVDQLRTAILDEYEVDNEVCDRDLTALLQALAEQNLIEVTNAEATQTVD